MPDIIRDWKDPESISFDPAPSSDCPSASPAAGFQILITKIVDQATENTITDEALYAQVTNGEEIRSSSQILGDYDVKYVVGLSQESDAELLTRTPVNELFLKVIDDTCQPALVPDPVEAMYTYNKNDPTSELVIELDAESNDCYFWVDQVVLIAPLVGSSYISVSNDGTWHNHR